MSRKLVATSAVFALAMLGLAGFASPAAALAGDTIMVPPGTYRESVLVTTSHLTITGSPAAVTRSRHCCRCARISAAP